MEHRFRLHPHEVWREGLVRRGVYKHSADFSDVLPDGVWDESRFVFTPYSPRHGENHVFGHVLFRPENGSMEENFFVGSNPSLADQISHWRPGEFFFGDNGDGQSELKNVLSSNQWGRIFYFNEQCLRTQNEKIPSDWGAFLCADGWGSWKWATRDGSSWGKAKSGIFRWHNALDEAARVLTHTPSFEIWTQLHEQLKNPESEAAFSLHWAQTEEDERGKLMLIFKRGSVEEAQQVLDWLAASKIDYLSHSNVVLSWSPSTTGKYDDSLWLASNFDEEGIPLDLQNALETLRKYFQVELRFSEQLISKMLWHFDRNLHAHITEPTAHERLEAQLQLTQWARERGLSFD